jgi:hypothetical protein
MASTAPIPVSSATLSFVPNQSIANVLIELGTLSTTRSPTSSTGDCRRSLAAVVSSATASPASAATRPAIAPNVQRSQRLSSRFTPPVRNDT